MRERFLAEDGGQLHGGSDLGEFFGRAFGGDGDDDGVEPPERVGEGDVVDAVGEAEADAGAGGELEGF